MRVILLSGKRFSGKDKVKDLLQKFFKNSASLSLADECKQMYAKENDLDGERLINDREYKEIHRNGLTEFYKKSLTENEFFFESYVETIIKKVTVDTIIIPDIRTNNNLKFFHEIYGVNCVTIRINSTEEEKSKRGWIRTDYDDSIIETELDNIDNWDYIIQNNGTLDELCEEIKTVANDICTV